MKPRLSSLWMVINRPSVRKRKLQFLPLRFASSSRQRAKAGAFAYVARGFCCLSLHRSQISEDLSECRLLQLLGIGVRIST